MYASLLISKFYSILPLWYSMVPPLCLLFQGMFPPKLSRPVVIVAVVNAQRFSSLCCSSYGSLINLSLLVAGLQYLLLTSIIALLQAKFSSLCDGLGRMKRVKRVSRDTHGSGKANCRFLHFPVFYRQNGKTTAHYLEILESLLVFWNSQKATDLESPI